jgi:DNA invertase Pin-like site-specific DNA recombinase
VAVIFYGRVSAAGQTIEHHREQAEAAGFRIDRVLADRSVSAAAARFGERPGGKHLFFVIRRGDTLVVPWVEHLGRDFADAGETIRHFMRQGVVVRTVTGRLAFDATTTDPIQQAAQDALIAFMAVSAQAEAAAMPEMQPSAIVARLVDEQAKYRGRKPSFDKAQLTAACQMLTRASSIGDVARATGLSRQTVYRIREDQDAARMALARWDA